MERIQTIYKNNPRARKIALFVAIFWILSKIYKKWKYAQKLFCAKVDIKSKTILITGCDTGFGNATAIKLSTKLGYRVIATCLKKESVDQFVSNSSFTANGSTATVLDVTKFNDIQRVKQFTIKYLEDTHSILWGIVNNAGFAIPGNFELVPHEMAEMEKNVLYRAPVYITREFLPLIYGRKNYDSKRKKTSNDGGRIVNVASAAARVVFSPDIRYGCSKAALSYFSHALRMDISPRFGIWVSAVEPGGYRTAIVSGTKVWHKRVIDKVEEENKNELLDIYDVPDIDKFNKRMDEISKGAMGYSPNIEEVVDCIIHGLTAKYPNRSYQPNWTFIIKFMAFAPICITEPIMLLVGKIARERMKKDN
eukprot:477597_1